MTAATTADLYLRLSDLRNEQQLDGREAKLRAVAERYDWAVHEPVIIENDLSPGRANGNGRARSASAFKRQRIEVRPGEWALRTVRPGFRSMIADLRDGVVNAILVEDLDRLMRQPRDAEDFLDAVELSGATVRSLTGSITLTAGGTDAERVMARVLIAFANKSSADTARRVKDSRARHAGASYTGGMRPYGYRRDPDAPAFRKTLIIVDDEAAVLEQAAADILDKGLSVRSVVRDLNGRGVPTAEGAAWAATSLRRTLIRPCTAGLSIHPETREFIDASWPAILPRERWDALVDKLTDPARHSGGPVAGGGREPRWLLTGIASCFCGGRLNAMGTHRGKTAYVCAGSKHLARTTTRVDDYVVAAVIARLSEPDADTYLMPPPIAGGLDTAALRRELRRLRGLLAEQQDLWTAGEITSASRAAGERKIGELIRDVEIKIASASRADPLAEFRGRPADVVWDSLTLARKRAVLRLVADITLTDVRQFGPAFNPATIAITWKE